MKHFLVILGLTALVWLGVSLSEEKEYPVSIQVHFSGYDTVKYALVQADTAIEAKAQMSGVSALFGSLKHQRPTVNVVLPRGRRSVAISEINDQLHRAIHGAQQVTTNVDSVRIVLSARTSRSYQPRLDDVTFTFTEQYGLCGDPEIEPATVELYGPEEALAKINAIQVAATTIRDVDESGKYRLPLEPIWEKYPDVHPSVREIVLKLPVEAYVEREFLVPVTVDGMDTNVDLRLYPDMARVRAWVPQREVENEQNLKVSIDYEEVLKNKGQVTPRLVQFPLTVRPRSLEPDEIQCVVIK